MTMRSTLASDASERRPKSARRPDTAETAETAETVETAPNDQAASGRGTPGAPSVGALVVELSQLEYAMRARAPREGWESAAVADRAFRSQLRRQDAIRLALRRRGVDFAGGSLPTVSPRDTGPPPSAAAGSVPQDQRPSDLALKVENLEHALLSRAVIGQATGILIERHKLTADAAFHQLATASQVTNRKLRDIAAELVETGLLPEPVG